MKLGDRCRVKIDLIDDGEMICIGFHPLSKGDDLPVMAKPGKTGMPVNKKWCTPCGPPDEYLARQLRKTYIEKYGKEWLLPEGENT